MILIANFFNNPGKWLNYIILIFHWDNPGNENLEDHARNLSLYGGKTTKIQSTFTYMCGSYGHPIITPKTWEGHKGLANPPLLQDRMRLDDLSPDPFWINNIPWGLVRPSPSMDHKKEEGPGVILGFWPSWEALVALLFHRYSGSQCDRESLKERICINSTIGFNPFLCFYKFMLFKYSWFTMLC